MDFSKFKTIYLKTNKNRVQLYKFKSAQRIWSATLRVLH